MKEEMNAQSYVNPGFLDRGPEHTETEGGLALKTAAFHFILFLGYLSS